MMLTVCLAVAPAAPPIDAICKDALNKNTEALSKHTEADWVGRLVGAAASGRTGCVAGLPAFTVRDRGSTALSSPKSAGQL